MARVTKMSPTVALGAYGLRAADVYVSTTGITHRGSCGYVRGKFGPTTDAARREMVAMSWCLRCCPDLATSPGDPDRPATHRRGCAQREPVRLAQSWELHPGLMANLVVCAECLASAIELRGTEVPS